MTIGLAGHIDHGKTSLVQSLTGKNTDNLKEEIKRGMTIDIGFAHFNKTISLIDVPGHEKFIKNMVSGVSSIDAAIVVIAADDGIMPQTIEHLEILHLLGIQLGLVVISKIDLVDLEWLELVELEINEFLKDTFLAQSKIFKVSTSSGKGIDLLKEEILKLGSNKLTKFNREIFRMFIDRVFIVKGFGTVVTGTVSSGEAEVGNKLELLPDFNQLKIRGLQSHDEKVKKITIGQRAAINIQSTDKVDIKRGSHLALKGYFATTSLIAVKFTPLLKKSKNLKHNQRIRLHLGTQESIGRILLINKKNKTTFPAFIKLERPIIASCKDRFVVRSYSPVSTIGGGVVLDINVIGKWGNIKQYIDTLFKCSNDRELVHTILDYSIKTVYNINSLSKKMGISVDLLNNFLSKCSDIIYIQSKEKWLVSSSQLERLENLIILWLQKNHNKNEYKNGFIKEEINEQLKLNRNILEYILSKLVKDKKIKLDREYYSLIDFVINLSENDKNILDHFELILDKDEFNIQSVKELSSSINQNLKTVNKIVKIQANLNKLFVLNDELVLTIKNFEIIKEKIINHFINHENMNVKQFKEMFDISRKYAVPLLEFLDKKKITYRVGNDRKINK